MVDVVIAGAGPAGLNAALIFGRAQRPTLVCDTGDPRNAPVHAMHGFLSRDGLDPAELRRIGREQLARYPSVELRDIAISDVRPDGQRFVVRLGDGSEVSARRLVLATGVVDELPAVEGLAEYWGHGVFNCPYCDGWEVRSQPLAVLGGDAMNVFLALNLVRWSEDVTLCTNGETVTDEGVVQLLASRSIPVRDERLIRVDGDGDAIGQLVFAEGPTLQRRAMFLHPRTRQRSSLPAQLGCSLLDDGSISVDDLGHTDVSGVYAAGDMARRPTMPFPGAQVVIAAAEGAVAALFIDQELFFEDLSTNAAGGT